MRVLVVEDDEWLGDGMRNGLKHYGFTVDWVKDGKMARQALSSEQFDIVVLDLGLPKMSGLEVLRNMRTNSITTPVVILTARETIEDRVKGLDMGADDYMVKPFDLEELAARLRALQRRTTARSEPTIIHGEVEINPASQMVTIKDKNMTISRREFALLQKLVENAGRVLSREHLTQTLYGWGEEIDSNALEVHIHNLRKKLGDDLLIRTIRGVGYMVDKPKGN
jgi:two-component system response regulator QseB